jgi:hypothetical protein
MERGWKLLVVFGVFRFEGVDFLSELGVGVHQASELDETVVPKKGTSLGAIKVPGDYLQLRPCQNDNRSQSIMHKRS